LRHSEATNIGTFHAFYSGNWLAYFSARPILRRFANRLHGRIAVSYAALGNVARYFPGDYVIIPNGIDLTVFNDQITPLEGFDDGKTNILFVGRLEKRKGFKYLIRAYARLKPQAKNTRLIVAGAYDKKSKHRYQKIVEEAGLEDVVFLGRLNLPDLARCYRACDIYCAPSIGGESFGIVLLEAMASRKPIVASDIDGYRCLVTPGQEGLLVPPRDDEALASALLRVAADKDMQKTMADRGFLKAQDYAWPKVSQRILEHYEKIRAQCGLSAFPGLKSTYNPVASNSTNVSSLDCS
jgi:phosphatidylinositol alpha-mannosyltransferase